MPVTKKTAVKKVVKAPVKKEVAKPAKTTPVAKKMEATLSVALFDATGKQSGTVVLPESVFGGKINKALMAQAVRVYLANQRMGSATTKTRGDVDGSTRKIYRQKGTGRARHGGIRAPIFVGGGIAHGPKLRDYSLSLSQKMKKASVVSALSAMAKEGHVQVVKGLPTLEPKTKLVAQVLKGMGLTGKKTLLVLGEKDEKVFQAARNIDRCVVASSNLLTTYEVLNAGTVVVLQEAFSTLEKQLSGVKKESK